MRKSSYFGLALLKFNSNPIYSNVYHLKKNPLSVICAIAIDMGLLSTFSTIIGWVRERCLEGHSIYSLLVRYISHAGPSASILKSLQIIKARGTSVHHPSHSHIAYHSVHGLSSNFLLANIIGFSALTIFTYSMLFSDVVRQEYRDRHGGIDNLVRVEDFAFAVHALSAASFTAVQFHLYKAGHAIHDGNE